MTTLRERPTEATTGSRPASRTRLPLRPHVLGAIFRRNFLAYFTNPAGYVFITLFVLVCSWAQFWQPVFFANNLANLDPLNQWMPYILLFFVPAITMSTWAEERRQGTEELLLTLPARDVEVVLGKYFAALGIYTVALAFLALGHLPILEYLGEPDYGVLAASYLGYWLMGAMLIAVGMVASILSGNVTVAFILGAVFCAVPVFAQLLGSPTAGSARRFIEGLSLAEQFRDFGSGVVPLSGLVYFLALAAGMLYLNMVLLGRRNWAGGPDSGRRWGHAAARVAAVVVSLVCLDVIVQKTMGAWRADATTERVHTLSPASISLIKKIPADRPVFIQAYLSPDVPREFVQTRRDLIDALKEYAAIGGSRIQLKIYDAERYSPSAREAEKRFGITPRPVDTIDDARRSSTQITLGVAFSSGLEEVVIPFFDRGLPIEYELTRSIRVVSGTKRKKVGVLGTDAKLLGGLDFQNFSQEREWAVVTELKKQYEVTQISADAPIPTDLDALLVAQPSSLAQRQIENLSRYVLGGGPTLLLLDPMPVSDPSLAPQERRQPPGGMFAGGPPPEPKGNLRPLLTQIGLDWPETEVVWNTYNPHKQWEDIVPENLFIARGAARDAFGDDPASLGLQEMVFPMPGLLRPAPGAKTDFIPLLRTDDLGGTMSYEEVVSGLRLAGTIRNASLMPGLQAYTIAARIKGMLPPQGSPPSADGKTPPEPARPAEARVIAIADLDFITDGVFELRKRPRESMDTLDFDNVPFILNCVDELAGDESFIPLRRRRAKHRTLLAVEEQSRQYVKKAEEEAKAADDQAKTELGDAQKRLDQQIEAIRGNKELDERTKETTVRFRQQVESQKLEAARAEIEDRKRRKTEDARAEREESIQRIQNGIRALALILPPLPALLLGGMVFFSRSRNENRGANPNRLA